MRDDIARDDVLRTLVPFIALIPVLILSMAYLIRQIFRPINAMATDIDQRKPDNLTAVMADDVTSEIRLLVAAIN